VSNDPRILGKELHILGKELHILGKKLHILGKELHNKPSKYFEVRESVFQKATLPVEEI